MFDSILSFVKKNNMITKGDRIVVGVSGGADSVCLLILLDFLKTDYDLYLHAVHVNHGIRAEGARHDEEFVRELCKEKGIPLEIVREDIPLRSELNHTSEEEEGRIARYDAFCRTAREHDCNKVAVAHNLDDNAETVLFNLSRGTGIKGMCGIRPVSVLKNGIVLIRPLLDTKKSEITGILADMGRTFCVDETNKSLEYSRNFIRNRVMKELSENINNSADRHIAEFAGVSAQICDFLQECVERTVEELGTRGSFEATQESIRINANALAELHPALRAELVRYMIESVCGKMKDITATHVSDVCSLTDKQSGRSISLPYNLTAERSFEDIRIFKKTDNMVCDDVGAHTISYRIREYNKNESIPKSNCIKWFDYDKIVGDIEIRTFRKDDYIKVKKSANGELGKKAIKSVFLDMKLPAGERKSRELLAVSNHVLWVSGGRGTDDFRVDDSTTHILEAFEVQKGVSDDKH